jgi:hypothetical protein
MLRKQNMTAKYTLIQSSVVDYSRQNVVSSYFGLYNNRVCKNEKE